MKIICKGWEVGLKKVSLTQYLKDNLGYSLTESHEMKLQILDKKEVEIYVPNGVDIKITLQNLQALGVICEIIE